MSRPIGDNLIADLRRRQHHLDAKGDGFDTDPRESEVVDLLIGRPEVIDHRVYCTAVDRPRRCFYERRLPALPEEAAVKRPDDAAGFGVRQLWQEAILHGLIKLVNGLGRIGTEQEVAAAVIGVYMIGAHEAERAKQPRMGGGPRPPDRKLIEEEWQQHRAGRTTSEKAEVASVDPPLDADIQKPLSDVVHRHLPPVANTLAQAELGVEAFERLRREVGTQFLSSTEEAIHDRIPIIAAASVRVGRSPPSP